MNKVINELIGISLLHWLRPSGLDHSGETGLFTGNESPSLVLVLGHEECCIGTSGQMNT